MYEGTDIIEFIDYFKTDEDCKKYLSAIKWKDGFKCRKCGNTTWSQTKALCVRKCNRCKCKESATAGTLFHSCKFPLRKAFMMVYYMSTTKKSISSHQLSRQLRLRQKTCWLFQQKIRQAMNEHKEPLLMGKVAVDEFVIGGKEQGKRGRGKGKKKEVVLAIQYEGKGIYNCYARWVKGCGTKQLRPFFEDHISGWARIKTDKWRGYNPLKKEYRNLSQERSNQGQNFPLIHRQIMMIKGWLRGIHHHCSHLQEFLDEFCFRFNYRFEMKLIFNILLGRMIFHKPRPYHILKELWGN